MKTSIPFSIALLALLSELGAQQWTSTGDMDLVGKARLLGRPEVEAREHIVSAGQPLLRGEVGLQLDAPSGAQLDSVHKFSRLGGDQIRWTQRASVTQGFGDRSDTVGLEPGTHTVRRLVSPSDRILNVSWFAIVNGGGRAEFSVECKNPLGAVLLDVRGGPADVLYEQNFRIPAGTAFLDVSLKDAFVATRRSGALALELFVRIVDNGVVAPTVRPGSSSIANSAIPNLQIGSINGTTFGLVDATAYINSPSSPGEVALLLFGSLPPVPIPTFGIDLNVQPSFSATLSLDSTGFGSLGPFGLASGALAGLAIQSATLVPGAGGGWLASNTVQIQ